MTITTTLFAAPLVSPPTNHTVLSLSLYLLYLPSQLIQSCNLFILLTERLCANCHKSGATLLCFVGCADGCPLITHTYIHILPLHFTCTCVYLFNDVLTFLEHCFRKSFFFVSDDFYLNFPLASFEDIDCKKNGCFMLTRR